MPFQKEFEFPSEEELTTQEVNLSISALRAGAHHLGHYCEKQNNEFMLCKKELLDPRKCLDQGKAVTNCALDFFRKVKKHCCKEFNQFSNCLYHSSGNMEYKYCRNTQAVFNKCVLDNLNLERPTFGTHAEVHIHHSDRPAPEKEIAYYPDAPDAFPYTNEKLPDPKFGIRSNSSVN